jgi:ABC-2 type transport system ATP-binding protein
MVYEHNVRGTTSSSSTRPTSTVAPGVHAEGLSKRFGDLWALKNVHLSAPAGSVLGLLGHNGAGKTTALRILTTLSEPTEGHATVAGFDVVRDAAQVRTRIGVAGQAATVDGLLTARANLEMVGRLYHLSRHDAKRRASELLERLELAGDADRLVKTFSGGMRRRLDLAASLVASPPVLFLDEPTTGLDPYSRNQLWTLLREHVQTGATLVLTTQYLEEADRLADDIVVLDHGKVAARGTPSELKARIGGERVVITLASQAEVVRAHAAIDPFLEAPAAEEVALAGAATADAAAADARPRLVAPVRAGTRLIELVRALDAAGIDAVDVQRREVTLDDVFLTITGAQRAHAEAA